MRIRHIAVRKLFGVFDHDIPLNLDERITIIYGPNGFGKTYTLSLVNELFNPGFGDFFKIPFGSVAATLEDGTVISVAKQESRAGRTLTITSEKDGEVKGHFEFHDKEEKCLKEPKWLKHLKEAVNIFFIHTERLTAITVDDWKELDGKIAGHIREGGDRAKIFTDIVNSRFLHKRIKIDDTGIAFETSYGARLYPSNLSSGEQQIILLLFRLLFEAPPDSLVLIDEPELSLHIVWQQEFLKDIDKILRRAPVDILVATHSPQIIHDRWDLTVELRGPKV